MNGSYSSGQSHPATKPSLPRCSSSLHSPARFSRALLFAFVLLLGVVVFAPFFSCCCCCNCSCFCRRCFALNANCCIFICSGVKLSIVFFLSLLPIEDSTPLRLFVIAVLVTFIEPKTSSLSSSLSSSFLVVVALATTACSLFPHEEEVVAFEIFSSETVFVSLSSSSFFF